VKRTTAAAALLGVCLAGCAHPSPRLPQSQPSADVSPAHVVRVRVPTGTASALGVYERQNPSSYNQTAQFNQAIGKSVNLALYFSGWGEGFQVEFAATARAHGAIPVVQIDPVNVSLAAIAGGKYDNYLRSYAASVRHYGTPVVIGFAHEPDGFWYSWGYNHVSPVAWVAAWRHVVNVFRSESARNVIWIWTMNVSGSSPDPLQAWWPGEGYVNWIGFDGYYASPSDTFSSVFNKSITQVRSFTHDPILIAETAVGPKTGRLTADVSNLLRGIRRRKLLGLIWFDAGGAGTRQDWRLEDHPAELAAFRANLRR
jgi:mannan endo-1,4-beta-mannosidase